MDHAAIFYFDNDPTVEREYAAVINAIAQDSTLALGKAELKRKIDKYVR
jgi:hypothetical protein